MAALAEDFFANKLAPLIKSQPLTEAGTADGLTVVVGKTFDEAVVRNWQKDILLEFYAPACGQCLKFAPIYEQVLAPTTPPFAAVLDPFVSKPKVGGCGSRR